MIARINAESATSFQESAQKEVTGSPMQRKQGAGQEQKEQAVGDSAELSPQSQQQQQSEQTLKWQRTARAFLRRRRELRLLAKFLGPLDGAIAQASTCWTSCRSDDR